jgi:divalent metal cation (Fe/Co/Zn/Cd) transporter
MAEEKRQRFLEVMARQPDLRGVHDLRTRTSGNRDFVQFHVWIDPAMTVREAHKVMDDIEQRLHAEFPDVEILIHPDPGRPDRRGRHGRERMSCRKRHAYRLASRRFPTGTSMPSRRGPLGAIRRR